MKVKYARVSTSSQSVESQFTDDLPLYADTISGAMPIQGDCHLYPSMVSAMFK
jgi:hypothetical protein